MENAITWLFWALAIIIPHAGLVWCLLTPTADFNRDAKELGESA